MEEEENSRSGWEAGRDAKNQSPADCNVSSTVYVGLATVAAATWWFLYDAEGPQVTFYQLVSG